MVALSVGLHIELLVVHIGAFRVLGQDPIICFFPFLENLLETRLRFSLSSLNELLDLQPPLTHFTDPLVEFLEHLELACLQLLEVTLFLHSEHLLLLRACVD